MKLSDERRCHLLLSGMWAGAMAGRQVVSRNYRRCLLADVSLVPSSLVLVAWRMLELVKECFASEEFLRGFPVAECSHLCNRGFCSITC